jgi:hypothetical protein
MVSVSISVGIPKRIIVLLLEESIELLYVSVLSIATVKFLSKLLFLHRIYKFYKFSFSDIAIGPVF